MEELKLLSRKASKDFKDCRSVVGTNMAKKFSFFSKQDYEEMESYIRGANFAFKNAEDLLSEAKILFKAGKYSRSEVLATFALEELGKAILILEVFLHFESKDIKIIKKFKDEMEKGFRGREAHKLKIKSVYKVAFRNYPRLLKTAPSQAELDHKSKLSSLYVEMKEGRFYPPKKPSREKIDEFLVFISTFLEFSSATFRGSEKIFYKVYKKRTS